MNANVFSNCSSEIPTTRNLLSLSAFMETVLRILLKSVIGMLAITKASFCFHTSISKSISADFSNYGKESVDLFAPGVKIYSTLPGINKYGNLQGTSMSTPIVTGLAALMRSYYPELSAVQLRKILVESVWVPDTTLVNLKPGSEPTPISFASLSKTGGIVNAYYAVSAADLLKPLTLKESSNQNTKTAKLKK